MARTRSLRALIALQAILAEHPHEVPTIDKLDLPSESVRDPFSNASLRMKRTEAGWLIYSVGSDGVDNGGAFENGADIGYLLPLTTAEKPTT